MSWSCGISRMPRNAAECRRMNRISILQKNAVKRKRQGCGEKM